MEIAIETVEAWAARRRLRYLGSPRAFAEFLLSAHITGLAVSMLLYPNQRFWVTAFAAATAIASKVVFRAPMVVPGAAPEVWPSRHFFNPSNFGITATLLLFPWVGIAPPYQFTENVRGWLDIVLPLLFVASGSFFNTRFTGRVPLIAAWAATFALQAILRSWWHDLPTAAGLLPMTGLAFMLFTFYMVTDPATTPSRRLPQIAFGAAVAIAYGLLVNFHIVFGLFFALTIVTAGRGVLLYCLAWRALADTKEIAWRRRQESARCESQDRARCRPKVC
jgi:hypothetical protein